MRNINIQVKSFDLVPRLSPKLHRKLERRRKILVGFNGVFSATCDWFQVIRGEGEACRPFLVRCAVEWRSSDAWTKQQRRTDKDSCDLHSRAQRQAEQLDEEEEEGGKRKLAGAEGLDRSGDRKRTGSGVKSRSKRRRDRMKIARGRWVSDAFYFFFLYQKRKLYSLKVRFKNY